MKIEREIGQGLVLLYEGKEIECELIYIDPDPSSFLKYFCKTKEPQLLCDRAIPLCEWLPLFCWAVGDLGEQSNKDKLSLEHGADTFCFWAADFELSQISIFNITELTNTLFQEVK